MKHRIIKSGGVLAGLFHHFAIPVLASLGCECPALGFPWSDFGFVRLRYRSRFIPDEAAGLVSSVAERLLE